MQILIRMHTGDKDDMGDDELEAINDLYILAGVCADFNITESIYARVMAIFSYNLTPDHAMGVGDDPDREWGWGVKGGFAIGYMF
jgi:hypothetical protein